MEKNNAMEIVESGMQPTSQIENLIYTIRGVQVILDRDLAQLYQVTTGNLNKAVKRNIGHFPERFMFQLTTEEWEELKLQLVQRYHNGTLDINWMFQNGTSKSEVENLKSQIVTSSGENSILKFQNGTSSWGGTRKLPCVFTEQGVTQLSAVLRSTIAVEVSIRINDAFHAMRRYITANAGVFQRLEHIERHQLLSDQRFDDTNTRIDRILDRMEDGTLQAKLGIYHTDDMKQAFETYNAQYPAEHCRLHTFNKAHDRFLIIDDEVYHFGASIKDLGKRWLGVNLITEHTADEFIARLGQ